MTIVKLTAEDGTDVEFEVGEFPAASGAMKDIYFSPDKSYVVAFFKKKPDWQGQERLKNIVGSYREKIFKGPEGEYWKKLFCWPTKIVHWNERMGIVCPAYDSTFYFSSGRFKGKEKEGKWFTSAKLFNRFIVPDNQGGTFFHRIRMCIELARAVRRLHAAGLSHSDLSYKNVLIDPVAGRATVIDIDGLVVPGKFPPDVIGTPDFFAPEVKATENAGDKRILPSKSTDLHALAVLIYMYLLNRHPLRGGKVWDLDPQKDEALAMGEKALFIEHPTDKRNRPNPAQFEQLELPQCDVTKRPYTICGPYLSKLFEQAFIDGLHNPKKRPTAQEWEDALIKTVDLMVPCRNPDCTEHWTVFDNTTKPHCQFCGAPYKEVLPVLDFYYSPLANGQYQKENVRLMVYNKQNIFRWHADTKVVPNEKISDENKLPVADFQIVNGRWRLINRRLEQMYEILPDKKRRKIDPGTSIELREGLIVLLSDTPSGRVIHVKLSNN